MWCVIRRSLIAGMLIGLSCEIFAQTENKIVGAFLFSIALLTICEYKLMLFTGRVGEEIKWDLTITLICNILGVILVKYMLLIPIIGLGIGCGMLMQIAVAMYTRQPIVTVMCVAAFILSGFKHCIAMIYDPIDLTWTLVVIGNIIGARLVATEIKK